MLVTLTDDEVGFLDQQASKYNLSRSLIIRLLLMNNEESARTIEKLAPIAAEFAGKGTENGGSVFAALLEKL